MADKLLKLPVGGMVLISDGEKASLLRNSGTAFEPDFTVEKKLTIEDNPPTRDLGTDRPGRAFSSVSPKRSAMEETDWHTQNEQRFAGQVAEMLEQAVAAKMPPALVISAPPKTLAELRQKLPDQVKQLIVLELNKDLTNHPVQELKAHLMEA